MAPVIVSAVAGLFDKVFGVVDQLVVDKDKAAEIKLEMSKLQNNLNLELLKTQTIPWVDATVKMLMAFRDLIIPMLRPVGGAVMTGFAAYCAMKGIELPPLVETIMASAFPGWMASRHAEKNKAK